MRLRMTVALLAILNALLALYLHLYKIGVFHALACDTGGCDRAFFSSRYGWFFGVDVSVIGAVGYILILATAIASLQPRWAASRGPVLLLLVLATLGFTFTIRLKYGEWVVLQTFCRWCAISAASITAIWVMAIVEWRRVGRLPIAD